jgi:NhaP-type Na+/H+ or K+/H+ antiporter
MDADVNMYAIIFGESIFNDAIGIVMYETVIKMGKDNKNIQQEILASVGEFCTIFTCSILIGAFSALFISWLLKR